MANKRVTDLPIAEEMGEGDVLHIVQNGVDRQIDAKKVGGSGNGIIVGTKAENEQKILDGEIKDGMSFMNTDEDGIYQPSDLNEIRNAINKLTTDLSGLIKTFDFSVKTSGGGNVALANFINLNEWTPIAVSARLANGTPMNAVLYQYSSSLPNVIGGIHCTLETDMSNNYVNADVKVRVTCLHFPQSIT